MAQYKTGTVNVSVGNAVVNGSGTNWTSAGIVNGQSFFLLDGLLYTIASHTDTTLTLTAPWAGSNRTGVAYAIHIDFTPEGLPLLSNGDVESPAVYNEAMRRLFNVASLGTAAFRDVTTSNTDTDTSRVMRPGNFGLGGTNQPSYPNGSDLNNLSGLATATYQTFQSSVTEGVNGWPFGGGDVDALIRMEFEGASNRGVQTLVVIRRNSVLINEGYRRTFRNGVFSEWRYTDPQGFGWGTDEPENLTVDVDTLTVAGSYRLGASSTNLPIAESGGLLVQALNSLNTTQIFITRANRMFIRGNSAGWTAWTELYHTGNLNVNEITTELATRWLMTGSYRASAGILRLNRPLFSYDDPSSISVIGTFDVFSIDDLAVVKSGVLPSDLIFSSTSSGAELVIDVNNLSGLTSGKRYALRAELSSKQSKITVNF